MTVRLGGGLESRDEFDALKREEVEGEVLEVPVQQSRIGCQDGILSRTKAGDTLQGVDVGKAVPLECHRREMSQNSCWNPGC